MPARLKKISITLALVLLVAAAGVVSGSTFHEVVATNPEHPCEFDFCDEVRDWDGTITDATCRDSGGVIDKNCNMTGTNSCSDHSCYLAGGGGGGGGDCRPGDCTHQ